MSALKRFDQTGVPLLLARLVLGGMFIYMGWAKIFDPVDFLKLIREYRMFPDGGFFLLNLTAVVLPWIEVLCGVLLILGVGLRGSALLLLVMLVGFTIVVAVRAIGIYQAQDIAFCAIKFDCGCGAGEQNICLKLPENVGLSLLALMVLVSRSQRFCLRRELAGLRTGTASS